MMTAMFAALATAAAQPGSPPPGETIVVTGERIADLRARLAACLARHCPPNEDVDASLALAEGEFLNGAYERSTDAIRASLRRNRRHSAAYPEPVADLYRSYARVEWHRGRDSSAVSATRSTLDTLRTGIVREDHRHFTARLEYISALSRAGQLVAARGELAALARAARVAGRDDVARLADMRRLLMEAVSEPGGSSPAFRRLEALARNNAPSARYESVSARMFLARHYRDRGNIARSDALLASIPRSEGSRRSLLYTPPYQLPGEAPVAGQIGLDASVTSRLLTDDLQDTWIDVGFWINPDGHVGDVQVVREGASSGWAASLLRSIQGRLYEPNSDPVPSYRLERYTFTAPYDVVTGTRIAQRSRRLRVEYMDLTTGGENGRAPETSVAPR